MNAFDLLSSLIDEDAASPTKAYNTASSRTGTPADSFQMFEMESNPNSRTGALSPSHLAIDQDNNACSKSLSSPQRFRESRARNMLRSIVELESPPPSPARPELTPGQSPLGCCNLNRSATARIPRSPLSVDPPHPLQRGASILSERWNVPRETAAVQWAAIHTPLGWSAAAVTAGPTLHLHFHSAYLRVDSSSLRDAVGSGSSTMANMAQAAPDGEYGGSSLPAQLQVARQQAAVLDAVSLTPAASDRMIESQYSSSANGMEGAAAGGLWEQLQATGWDTSVPVVLTSTAMALLQGKSEVVPIEPDADGRALGIQISCGAYDIMTGAGLPVLHLLSTEEFHNLAAVLVHEVHGIKIDINLQQPQTGSTLLHDAANAADAATIGLLSSISDSGRAYWRLDTELRNKEGSTALMLALSQRSADSVFALLEAGALVEPQMALQAVKQGDDEVAMGLLRRVCESDPGRDRLANMLEHLIDQLSGTSAQHQVTVFDELEQSATLLIRGGVPIPQPPGGKTLLEHAIDIGSGVLIRAVGANSNVDTWPHALVALRKLVEVHEMALLCGTRETLALAIDDAVHERDAALKQLSGKRRDLAQGMLDEKISQLRHKYEALPTTAQRRRLYVRTAALLAVASTCEQTMHGLVHACGTPRTKEAFALMHPVDGKWAKRLEEQRQDSGAVELAMRLLALAVRSGADEKEALGIVELVLVHCDKEVVNDVLATACEELASKPQATGTLRAAALAMLHAGADPTAACGASKSPLGAAMAAGDDAMIEMLVMESRAGSQRNAVAALVQQVAGGQDPHAERSRAAYGMLARVLMDPDLSGCLDQGLPDGMGNEAALRVALEINSLPLLQALLSAAPAKVQPETLFIALKLMFLCVRGSEEWQFLQAAVDELVAAAVTVQVPNKEGYLPLDLAMVLGESGIIWLLRLATDRNAEEKEPVESHAIYALLLELCSSRVPVGLPNPELKHRASAAATGSASGEMGDATSILKGDIHNMEVEALVAGDNSIGHRPVGPIGSCSLAHWHKSVDQLLLSSIVGNPLGTKLTFKLKADLQAANSASDEMIMVCMGLGVEPLKEENLYTGRLLKKSTAQLVAAMLVDSRRSYLEQTALQLLSEGFCLKPPACLINPESTVMLAAKSGNATLAHAVIAASPPTATEVIQLLDLAQSHQGTLSERAELESLASLAVEAAPLDPASLGEMLKTAVAKGIPSLVRSLASKGAELDSEPFLVQSILVAGEADQILGYGSAEVARKWQVVQVLIELGSNPDGIGAASQKPLTVARNLLHTAGRTQAIAALVEGGATVSSDDFIKLVREWVDGEGLMEQVVVQIVKQGGTEVVTLGVGYNEETVLDVGIAKLSKAVVQAVFKKVMDVVQSGGASLLLVSLEALFASLVVGSQATEALAIDLDNDGVETQSEFAANLAALLTCQQRPVLHQLVRSDEDDRLVERLVDAITSDSSLVLDLHVCEEPDRANVLHVAAKCGRANAIRSLAGINELQLTSNLDLELTDAKGKTALAHAVEGGSTDAVEALVELGCAVPPDMLALAARCGSSEIARSLATEASVAEVSSFRRVALHWVADGSGDVPTATSLLDAKANVDAADVDGMTALEMAVMRGHKPLADLLIHKGADPIHTDRFGETPLTRALADPASGILHVLLCAISEAQVQLPQAMLEAVAVEAVKAGETWLLDELIPAHKLNSGVGAFVSAGWPMLWWAIHFGRDDTALQWLSEGKCSQAAALVTPEGRNILHWMSQWHCGTQTVWKLVAAKANVELCDAAGDDPLAAASRTGHMPLVQTLLGDQDIDTVRYCSSLAAAGGHTELAKWLEQSSGSAGASGQAAASNGWFGRRTRSAAVRALKKLFTSKEFPPVAASVGRGKPQLIAQVEWRRVGTLCGGLGQATLFGASLASGKALSNPSMDTGSMGSAWFWCALAMCDVESLQSHFSITELAAEGKYSLKLHGRDVVIDDLIPCIGDAPAHGRLGSANEAWSMLICKAYAQVAGSYSQLFCVEGLTQPAAQQAAAADPEWLTQYFDSAKASQSEQNSVGPCVALARMLSNSPLCQDNEQQLAVTLAENLSIPEPQLSQRAEAPAKVTQVIEGQPRFKLEPANDCDVIVEIGGLLKAVTSLTLSDKAGAVVASTEHIPLPNPTQYVWVVSLSMALAPYILRVGGAEDDLDQIDFDIKCPSVHVDVTML